MGDAGYAYAEYGGTNGSRFHADPRGDAFASSPPQRSARAHAHAHVARGRLRSP